MLVFDRVTHVIYCYCLCGVVASVFHDTTISKRSCNLFLVIEPTGRISLASFSDLQCHACD